MGYRSFIQMNFRSDSICPSAPAILKAKKLKFMTRRGKIARLPRHIRDQLNQRLDDGEQGTRLIEWLNSLPEVKQVLDAEFEGRPISDSNLSDWRMGGFLDWQAQQEARALLLQLRSNDDEFAKVPAAELVEPLTTVITAHYAAALYRSTTDTTEQPDARVKRLGKSLRDLDRLRGRAQAGERIQIQRQWFELDQQIENRRSQSQASGHAQSPPEPKISEEEKARRLKEYIYPRDLFPEKYKDEQTRENGNQQQNV